MICSNCGASEDLSNCNIKEDSKIYLECLQSAATKKESNGYYSFKPAPGFGLEIDTNRLKKINELYIEV